MTYDSAIDRAAAGLLVLLTALVALREWGVSVPPLAMHLATLSVIVLLSLRVRVAQLAFVLAGIALTLWLMVSSEDWRAITLAALDRAAFIAAFFTALATLRNVAATSPSLRRAGGFLAAQPPGRRYAALSLGGHLFALLLNYGSISLLGSLATHAAQSEDSPVIRRHRTRRMLLAIQRGFISSLPWSPLGFAMAISTALVPGATWASAVIPGLGSALIIALSGWAMDSIFKPRLGRIPPRKPVEGSWALLLPLFGLLVLLAVSVTTLHVGAGVRIIGVVMLVVPSIAIGWAVLQRLGVGPEAALGPRAADFLDRDLPGYRGEITLLVMAGYIGTVGAPVLQPLVLHLGLDPSGLPTWAILVLLVWIIPALGQLGMNPILAVVLISPLIPTPEALGITPAAMVAAIVSGWAMTGATSPFTATTLLIGAFGNVSARHVGLRWNGGYFLVAQVLLTAWVLLFALVIA